MLVLVDDIALEFEAVDVAEMVPTVPVGLATVVLGNP